MRKKLVAIVHTVLMGLFLLPAFGARAEAVARFMGEEYTREQFHADMQLALAREAAGSQSEPPAIEDLSEQAHGQLALGLLLRWMDERLEEHRHATFPVSDAEVEERRIGLIAERILIDPDDPQVDEYLARNRAQLDAMEAVAALDDPTEEELASIFDQYRASYAEADGEPVPDMLLGMMWRRGLVDLEYGAFCFDCIVTTREQLLAANMESARKRVTIERAADQVIEAHALMESERVRAEVTDILDTLGVDVDREVATRAMLRRREAGRWRIRMMREHLLVLDAEVAEIMEEYFTYMAEQPDSLRRTLMFDEHGRVIGLGVPSVTTDITPDEFLNPVSR